MTRGLIMSTSVINQTIPFTFFFSGVALSQFNKELVDLKCQLYVCSNEDLPALQEKIFQLERSLKFTQTLTR